MQALFPPCPYILTNRHMFMYMEAECPKHNNDRYLCEKKNNQLRTSPDCIQTLIHKQTIEDTCGMTTITLYQDAMEELDGQHYILSFPRPTQVHTVCKREDFITLNGSFLATIPLDCTLHAGDLSISNTEDNVAGQPLKILDIKYENGQERMSIDHLNLKSIDLRNLHSIQNKVMQQPTLHTAKEFSTLYHTTIPFYVILLSTLALISTIVIVRRYRTLPRKNTRDKIAQENNHQRQDDESSSGIQLQEQFPATFYHTVLK